MLKSIKYLILLDDTLVKLSWITFALLRLDQSISRRIRKSIWAPNDKS